MTIHIEHPESTEQIEAWADIMLRVDGLRMDVDEFRHYFEQDTESLWALALPEACVIALEGNEVVGYTALRYGAGSPEAENRLTAVRRPWRRRGIASALKRAQIEAARAVGIETISTTNDELNVGMRGVNERLGYEPEPERIVVSGPA